jgi:hypothetical protein
MEHEDSDAGDDLTAPAERPFRPWGASGVPQPGADRPAPRVPPATGAIGPDLLPGPTDTSPGPDPSGPLVAPPSNYLPQGYPSYPKHPGGAAGPGGLPGYGHHPGYPQQPVRVEHVYVNAPTGVSGSGLASFILGILSFLIPWFGLLSFAAVVLGLWSRGSSRVGRGSSGDGFAIAGLILGVTSLLLYLVLFRGLMFLFLFR